MHRNQSTTIHRGKCVARVVAVAAILFCAERARAQAPRLAFEVHETPDRPAVFVPALNLLDDQLEARGVAARSASILRLAQQSGAVIARPGQLDPGLTKDQLIAALTDGFGKFSHGICDEAIPSLEKALAQADRNPELLVDDEANNDILFNSMVGYAVCLRRANNQKWTEVIDDVIRRWPSRPVSRQAVWGPEGEQTYLYGMKDVATLGRGSVTLAAGGTSSPIFLDLQHRTSSGHVSIGDLVGGLHHVFMRLQNGIGRQYVITVKAGGDQLLTAIPDFDTALVAADDWFGFALAPAEARRHLDEFAAKASLDWTKNNEVGVVKCIADGARPYIEVALVRNGEEARTARAFVDTFTQNDAAQLAELLVSGQPGKDINVIKSDYKKPRAVAASEPRNRRPPLLSRIARPASISMMVIGGAAIVGGTAMAMFGGDPYRFPYSAASPTTAIAPQYLDLRTPGIIVGVAGAVVGAAGVVWYVLHRQHPPRYEPAVELLHEGAVVGFGGRF